MFLTLRECGALARILPEVDALFGVPQRADYHPEIDCGDHVMRVLDYAAAAGYPLTVRFAALGHDLGKALTPDEVLPRHIGHEERGIAPLAELCRRLREEPPGPHLKIVMVSGRASSPSTKASPALSKSFVPTRPPSK